MKNRVFFLGIILLVRFILGWVEVSEYRQNSLIRVTGNIYNIDQTDTKCIIRLGRFFIDYRNDCSFSRQAKLVVVGRVRGSVIDRFLGRLWLDSAEITVLRDEEMILNYQNNETTLLARFREKMVDKYRKYLTEPESSLVAGIVLGYKKDIGRVFYEQMINSGTIHIAVASGYNIMLVGGTVLTLCFWLLKRKWATIAAIGVMLLYALEAGAEPPVMRALIMGGVVFAAAVWGRRTISWWLLLVTGWVMVLIEPLLFLDTSFQLSMAASVGLMVVEPKIRIWLERIGETGLGVLAGSGLLTSLATMLTTMPIIWWKFGRMSLIGIVSNTLILPLVPVLMIFGVGMQVLPRVFSWPVYVLAHWMVGVIQFFGT